MTEASQMKVVHYRVTNTVNKSQKRLIQKKIYCRNCWILYTQFVTEFFFMNLAGSNTIKKLCYKPKGRQRIGRSKEQWNDQY
jgi:hypothetical protein